MRGRVSTFLGKKTLEASLCTLFLLVYGIYNMPLEVILVYTTQPELRTESINV
jgi:hypothetical protein